MHSSSEKTANSLVKHVAVVGAGISGLACARKLVDNGLQVTVFEKSRGVGGRMATRRAADQLRFDHGAQYFTARDSEFRAYVDSWIDDGLVAIWRGRIGVLSQGIWEAKEPAPERFVGVPGMNAICRHLAAGLNVRFQTRVAPPEATAEGWRLRDEQGEALGQFDYLLVSAPAPQTAELLTHIPSLGETARGIEMQPCWAALITPAVALDVEWDAAFVHESPLAWVARNSSKPQRSAVPDTWVLHAAPDWTANNLDREADDVLPDLLDAFQDAMRRRPLSTTYAVTHRWRYALPPEPHDARCLFDAQQRAGACGDWCGGPRVEGAFLSGLALAERVLNLDGLC